MIMQEAEAMTIIDEEKISVDVKIENFKQRNC